MDGGDLLDDAPQGGKAESAGDEKDWLEADNRARLTVVQIAGGCFLLAGASTAYFQYQEQRLVNEGNRKNAQESLRLTIAGQVSDRFSRAIDLLVNPKPDARVAGVYMLERASREDEGLQSSIVSVLSALIRNARSGETPAGIDRTKYASSSRFPLWELPGEVVPPPEVQAAMRVLGRNSWAPGSTPTYHRSTTYYRDRMDLSNADLRGADLTNFQRETERGGTLQRKPVQVVALMGARLERAILKRAALEMVQLSGARLDEAFLDDANLDKAIIWNVSLAKASMTGASMRWADMSAVNLEGADLAEAWLEAAMLDRVNFTRVRMDHASLRRARFSKGSTLAGASLKEADLRGCNLKEVEGLTAAQVQSAYIDDKTVLPAALAGVKGKDGPVPFPD